MAPELGAMLYITEKGNSLGSYNTFQWFPKDHYNALYLYISL